MNYAKNKIEQDALAQWLTDGNFTVFGTLKFTDGTAIGRVEADRLVQRLFNKLDRTYFGNATTNVGMRHSRIVFRHMGTSQANLHYHFLAKPMADPTLYAQLARITWADLSGWTMGYEDTKVEVVRDRVATSKYIVHEYDQLGADSFTVQASSLSTPKYPAHKYRGIAQLRRLLTTQQLVAQDP